MTRAIHVDPQAAVYIKKWRESLGLTRLQAARRLGVSKTAVSNWELSVNEPKREIYGRMAEEANVSDKKWFFTKLGLSETNAASLTGSQRDSDGDEDSIEIKVFKSAGAGVFRSIDETPDHVVSFPRAWLTTTQKLVGLVVAGDSMSPLIETGFIVIVDRTRRTAATALNHIVAASDGVGVAIKYLVERDGGYWLTPHNMNIDNRPTPVGPSTRIIGVVVKWIGQPVAPRK